MRSCFLEKTKNTEKNKNYEEMTKVVLLKPVMIMILMIMIIVDNSNNGNKNSHNDNEVLNNHSDKIIFSLNVSSNYV